MQGFRQEQSQHDGGEQRITQCWVWLSRIPYIGTVTANRLLREFGTAERIFESDIQEIAESRLLTGRQLEMMRSHHSLEYVDGIMNRCRELGIKILTVGEELYDARAKTDDAPIVLYYRGNLRKLGDTVGIVGARRCTPEARLAAIESAVAYAGHQATVISGMAKGVDSYAHTACLNENGNTIAFLANGLDICYPKEHAALMKKIIDKGTVLSEYPPGTSPTSYQFPVRNRLISAWSDKLLVIGAGRGSGAYITADFAEKYGKSVEYLVTDCTARVNNNNI